MARNFANATDCLHFAEPDAQPTQGCFAFWMKSTQATANVALPTYWSNTGRNGWGLLMNATAGKITAQGWDSSLRLNFTGAVTVNDGNPHHVAFNFHRGAGFSNQLYVDGALDNSQNSSASWGSGGTNFWYQLGDNVDAFFPTFVGDLWECAAWYGAQLNADEIAALAKGASPQTVRPGLLRFHAPLVRDTKCLRRLAIASQVGGTASPHGRILGGTV
jgi:hypothetical protein